MAARIRRTRSAPSSSSSVPYAIPAQSPAAACHCSLVHIKWQVMTPRQRVTQLTHSPELKVTSDKDEAKNKVLQRPPSDTHKPLLRLPARTFLVNMGREGGPRDLDRYTNMLQSSPHQYSHTPIDSNPAYNKATCSPELKDKQREQEQKTLLTPKPPLRST